MEELGIECLVGHPSEIRAAEPRKQKRDRRDADLFLSLLIEERSRAKRWDTLSGGLAAYAGGAAVTVGAIRVTFWGGAAMALTAGHRMAVRNGCRGLTPDLSDYRDIHSMPILDLAISGGDDVLLPERDGHFRSSGQIRRSG